MALLVLGFGLLVNPFVRAGFDLNSNGMDDVWEQFYNASTLLPSADDDGDGKTNLQESLAGTDPRNGRSLFAISQAAVNGADVLLGWNTEPGKAYRILATTDPLANPWLPVSGLRTATATTMQETVLGMGTGGKCFFRVEVLDSDTDSDGVSDWDELHLPGFNPAADQSRSPGTNDFVSLNALFSDTASTVTISATTALAAEKEGVNGVFRVSRTGGLKALTVPLVFSGSANPQKGSATPDDYTLVDGAGQLLTDSVTIPFGGTSVDIIVRPVKDALVEGPEALTTTVPPGISFVVGGNSSAFVTIADAANFDLSGDAVDDVWEQFYNASGLLPSMDSDGDGATNFQESLAGTDPRNARSLLAISKTVVNGTDVLLDWNTEPGKAYRILATADLGANSWLPVSAIRAATATTMQETLVDMGAGKQCFFRVEVLDADTDSDGVSDWDELHLPGFNPAADQSRTPGTNDLVSLTALFSDTASTVTITATTPLATEKEGVNGAFRITRSGGLKAITVPLVFSGNANLQKGSATPDDYTLVNGAGQPLTDSVTVPFGATSVDIIVRPVKDALVEVPEALTATVQPGSGFVVGGDSSGAVTITDAANSSANERLFLAFPSSTTGSTATGVSTIRLQGDNTTGMVGLNFSGLSSAQTTSFLSLNNNGSGVYVKGLPFGQVTDFSWSVKAAGFLATDQQLLDALFAGNLGVVINSTANLMGEIQDNYTLVTGSINPPVTPATPAIETLTGDALRRDVARFLTQSTFGPNETEIASLASQIETTYAGDRIAGYRAWIQAQFALNQTKLENLTFAADAQEWALRGTDPINYTSTTGEPFYSNKRRAWWTVVAGARDQLRQRLAFALSEIFVISEKNSTVSSRHYGAARYYDTLGAHADGNYRSLLRDISKSPMMGVYLSHLQNQKAVLDASGATLISPDENYAREIMQLFSVGLVALHPDGSLKLASNGLPTPTYTNADITELARVFTGWSFSKKISSKATGYLTQDNTTFAQSNGPSYFQDSWLYPMINFSAYHDIGAKTVLGTAIPANLDGEADLGAALDILFNHPNTPPFICRLLIQRLVTSNPSAGYINRVAQIFINDGTGTRGNLRAVVEAILLDPEARNLAPTENIGYGKQKEPLLRYVQLLRAFSAFSMLPLSDLTPYGYPSTQLANFPNGTTRLRFSNTDSTLGQTPHTAPSVFNWFLPDYSPGGAISSAGLVAPEMLITNETQTITAINYTRTLLNTSTGQSGTALVGATDLTLDDVRINRTPWETIYNNEIAAGKTVTQAVTTLVDRLDMLLMAGRLRAKYSTAAAPNPRTSIINSASTWLTTGSPTTSDRVINLLYLMGDCPEFQHQK